MASGDSILDSQILRQALLSKDELLLNQLLDRDICDTEAIRNTLKGLNPSEGAELVELLTHKLLRDYTNAERFAGWIKEALLQFRRDAEFSKTSEATLQALRAQADSKRITFSTALKLQLRVAQLSKHMKQHIQKIALSQVREKSIERCGHRNRAALVTLKVLKRPPKLSSPKPSK
eukprot:Gregarina_sp_Poly_1__5605@NODE_295_length_9857_cov_104_674974_g255_i0_p5_GENE_NODE_295_length_9857_cov_104_674974_g255_i0NODE_295_length_9857_cov_104_674974_g255_i0_p5_ORF_typecomplete_len176_score33_48Utp12/PF04003_12/0_01M_domain/PF12938_7/0_23M_domain/PF12938_7/2_5e02_NODE_295_length_9857_cov_104_674974_g255_i07051232